MEYFTPSGAGETEITERRSRFIGHILPVTTEDAAKAEIARLKARYHDARHNCWCYILRDGETARYADDGEPQGTAGQPMLSMLRHEGVTDVCCVVTRYFGGVLLGSGGLARAYTAAAKQALEAAGVSRFSMRRQLELECPYQLAERVKSEIAACGGELAGAEYLEQVKLRAVFAETDAARFAERLTEITAGGVAAVNVGDIFVPEK
jgi:uncharacterized YigZ family protein